MASKVLGFANKLGTWAKCIPSNVLYALAIAFIGSMVLSYFQKPKRRGRRIGGKDVSLSLSQEHAGDKGSSSISANGRKTVLKSSEFQPFKLIAIKEESYNTKLFRFEIPSGYELGLPIGRHISVRALIGDNQIMRAYTPTSSPAQDGYFELLVKAYEFGKVTTYLHNLEVGETVEMRGPVGRFSYEKNQYSVMGMIAGGTGITPCLQVLRHILEVVNDKTDKTQFILFYQNRSEKDILLRRELDAIVTAHPKRFEVVYFLSNPVSDSWGSGFSHTRRSGSSSSKERRGYIQQGDIDDCMSSAKAPRVCLCGPSGFNSAMKELLLAAGHDSKSTGTIYVW
jgi:cytochrome-b5 reductase